MDLVICEIFNKKIHGFDDNNDPTVVGHYMVSHNFTKSFSNIEDRDFEDDTDSEYDDDEDTDDEDTDDEDTDD
jgi:ribonuclease E